MGLINHGGVVCLEDSYTSTMCRCGGLREVSNLVHQVSSKSESETLVFSLNLTGKLCRSWIMLLALPQCTIAAGPVADVGGLLN